MAPSTRALALDLLATIGYGENHVRTNVPALVDDHIIHADLVAFGRLNGPFDASTATIVVEFADDIRSLGSIKQAELGHVATALSAPAVIVAYLKHWTLFAVQADGDIHRVRELSWETDLGELREMLNPRILLEAKLGSRQLSLFPVAAVVSKRGRAMRQESLAPRVENALLSAAEVMFTTGIAETQQGAHARAARAVISALTTVVLRDKTPSTVGRSFSTDVLVNRAIAAHPQQFSWLTSVSSIERELTETLVGEFTDIDFSAVEPMLLSELYENRLMDDAQRRRLGTHYTPPGLARRMLAWLPIEEIEPDRRFVYDPMCGSGSLLIAAHDRLRDLQPENIAPTRSHAELAMRIQGADTDPLAVAIADLALFLNALPAGNGWQITQRDFFANIMPEPTPSVIIANPPWEYRNEARQDDQAQRILGRLIAQVPLEGLLGVILPVGWLTRRSLAAQTSRAQLFDALDVFEVWRLPSGTFSKGSMGAAVVLGRRADRSMPARYPTVHRRISDRRTLGDFFDRGSNQCVLSWSTDSEGLGKGPLRAWWESGRRRKAHTISFYATAIIGPQPESPKKLAARRGRQAPNVAIVRWDSVAEFGEVHDGQLVPIGFPEDMQNRSRRGELILNRPKIFVSGVKNPERPWRIKVALDSVGDVIARNTVTAIMPIIEGGLSTKSHHLTEQDLLYGLFAFMGSGFVSAWLDEAVTTRYIGTTDLLNIPVPGPTHLSRFARIGKRLLTGEKVTTIEELERQVWEWAGLPDSVLSSVIDRLNEAPAPEGRLRYPSASRLRLRADSRSTPSRPSPLGLTRPRAGAVVRVGDQTVTLAIPGLTEPRGTTMAVPHRMPGALLRPGVTMIALDDGGPMQDMSYLFDEVAYMSADQVSSELVALVER